MIKPIWRESLKKSKVEKWKGFEFFAEFFGFQNRCDSFGYELELRSKKEKKRISR